MSPRVFCRLTIVVLAGFVTGGVDAAEPMHVSWTNRILTVRSERLPQGHLEVLYLEAFLRPGAQGRDWRQSVLPHQTLLIGTNRAQTELRFRTQVEPDIEVMHEVRARADELDFTFTFRNRGSNVSVLQWFQPACIRVDGITGRDQAGYTARSFVFTGAGLTTLDRVHRTEDALYRGGQVYLPPWTLAADANPRPLCEDRVVNGLIGCFSADNRWILATASSRTHEVFEGVYVCLHSDPLIGGLKPGEVKRIRQKIYWVPNDPQQLLKRYRRDFGGHGSEW